jgi:hypothetical protein
MKPTTVAEYLANLPADRHADVSRVRELVNRHMPAGYEEGLDWGAITWSIPLTRLPDTYNGRPLCYVALGTHKSFNTLYLMGVYGDPKRRKQLEDAFKKAGKKMDMGKSCLHFHSADDLPLDAIGTLIAGIPSEKWVAIYQASRGTPKKTAKAKTRSKAKAHSSR